MIEWFSQHQPLLAWITGISIVTSVISLLSLPWLVSRIPEDYFLSAQRHPSPWKQSQPVLRMAVLIGKNLLGAVLLTGGLVMIFVPGQGLLTIAMGILLLDYPGKFKLERRVVRIPRVIGSLNWLRGKIGARPLLVDDE